MPLLSTYMASLLSVFSLVASVAALGPSSVDLGTAANYAILAQTGVSSVPESTITGNLGLSPASATYYTGFSLEYLNGSTFATSVQVTGEIFAANYGSPTPSTLDTAIGDSQTAYNDAATRADPDFLNLGGGTVSGLTLAPGLYNWGTTVEVTTDITVAGTALDTWIFQIAGELLVSTGVKLTLAGGALASNIVWVVAAGTTLGSDVAWEGIILDKTAIHLNTGASINGRLLAQSAVTLQSSTVDAGALQNLLGGLGLDLELNLKKRETRYSSKRV